MPLGVVAVVLTEDPNVAMIAFTGSTAVAAEYLDRLADRAANLAVGDPHRAQVALGPLISERQPQNVDRIVTATVKVGAEVRAGATYQQLFYAPTVPAGVTSDMPAFREEIFGPVAPVVVVKDEAEAIAVANDTEYGLVAPSRPDLGIAVVLSPSS